MATLDALRTACREGDSVCIRRFLALKGPELLSQDKSDNAACSCLWLCAERGYTEGLGTLVRAGWSVNGECTPHDTTAAHAASVTPLYVAAQNGHIDSARVLLEYGAAVEAERASSGATALYVANQQGDAAMVRLLLDHGAQVDHCTHDGITPLMVAAYQGHLDCLVLLLRAGADPQRRARGQNVSQWAAAGGHAQVFETARRRASAGRTPHGLAGAVVVRAPTTRRAPPPTPDALDRAAEDLALAVRADRALFDTRVKHLDAARQRYQRGEDNIFTVRTVQEVEQVLTAWERYKSRLSKQAKAHAALAPSPDTRRDRGLDS